MRVKAAGPAGYKQDHEPRTAPYILLAGPNGAGKTTASGHVLRNVPGLIHYLNADRIANGLAPEHPEGVAAQAARILLGQFDDLVRQRVTFAVETTLSGRAYAGRIRRLRQEIGYRFELVYLWLPSPELSKQRVASRVLAGGHFIPTDDVFRRYDASLRNRICRLPIIGVCTTIPVLLRTGLSRNRPTMAASKSTTSNFGNPWRPAMLETHNGQTATVRPMNVLDNTGALTRAMQRAGREELIRHKKLGNTIATWQDGQVVLVTGDDIVIPDDPDA